MYSTYRLVISSASCALIVSIVKVDTVVQKVLFFMQTCRLGHFFFSS